MIKNTEISKDDIQIIYKTIGQNVKKIREAKGISQLNLAMAIGQLELFLIVKYAYRTNILILSN